MRCRILEPGAQLLVCALGGSRETSAVIQAPQVVNNAPVGFEGPVRHGPPNQLVQKEIRQGDGL